MGTGNAAVRQWMSNPERFADLFNGMVFEGEQVIQKYVQNYRINSIDVGNLKNLERFQTDLQEIFGMIQCKGSKEKLIEYLREKESYFRNVDEETYQAIREFLHSERILKGQIKKEEGKETVDMCKALEDLYNDGIERGMEQGIEQGSIAGCKKVNRLNCILAEKKRIDDIIRASVDVEYQQKLFEEFAL